MTRSTSAQPKTLPQDASDDLYARVLAGEQAAFSEVVRELQKPLYYSVLRLVRHQHDARDIVQKTFVKAWTKRGDVRDPKAFRSWLFSIGLNLARNHIRDTSKRTYEPVEENTLTADSTTDEELSQHQKRQQLRRALQNLPPKQREVVTMRIDGELSFAEIGEAVGSSPGSARVNFHHGMKKLRELLGLSGGK